MTAAGKITAARVQTGDRILVKHYTMENETDRPTLEFLGTERALGISTTKTGQGVTVARVLKVEAAMTQGRRRAGRVYDIYTTEGVISNCAPAQTMIMAPEDNAGVKRAHVEALALNATYEAYPLADEVTEAPAVTEDAAYEVQEAEVAAAYTMVPRQAGKTATEAPAATVPAAPEAEEDTEYLDPIRTRWHGKTKSQRKAARKSQRAARRRTRRSVK